MDIVRKAVVALVWTDKNHPTSAGRTTGFIHKKNDEGLFILSTCHQFRDIFKNPTQVPKSGIEVKVEFFDRTTVMDADVLHLDMAKDLTVITVTSCAELKTHPIACIEPISFSMDPPNCNQSVYTFHHPAWFNIATCEQVVAFNQYTDGFIVDNYHQNSGLLRYSMPLIFPGSSGAPVFNKNSNKLVSMIVGHDPYHNVPESGAHAGTMWGEVHDLHQGPTVSAIQQFLNEAETPNPSTSNKPTTESDQSGDTGTESDTDDVIIG